MLRIPDHPVIRSLERDGYPLEDEYGPKVVYECDECGENIYEGEMCYKLGGKIYCRECVEASAVEADRYEY